MRQIILPILIASLGVVLGGLWWMEAWPSEAEKAGPRERKGAIPREMRARPSEAEVGGPREGTGAPSREEGIESTPSPVGERRTSGSVPRNLQAEIEPRNMRLEGRFVDPWNRPLIGVDLQLGFRRTWRTIATTDETGRFGVDVEVDRTPFYIKPDADVWICGKPLKFDAEDPPGELFVRATRFLRFEGQVLTDHGEPVPGGRLDVEGAGGVVGKPESRFTYYQWSTEIALDGRFRVDVPSFPGLNFLFSPPLEYRSLWGWKKVPVPLESREEWTLIVPLKDNVIDGTVRSASGERIMAEV